MTADEREAAWIARQLATARPFTQEQQQALRRLLTPARKTA